MIFSVQNSFSHSMVLFSFFFFLSLCRLIKWIEEKNKRKTKLISSIEDTRPGWTRRTEKCLKEVSMSLLPYAFSCMARWSISCCLCVECVCSYQQSLAVTLTEGLLLLHLESKAPLPRPKNHPLPFRESCRGSHSSLSSLKQTLPVASPFWADPAAKKKEFSHG